MYRLGDVLLVFVGRLIRCLRGFGIIRGWLIPFTCTYMIEMSTVIWEYIPFIQKVGETFPSLASRTSKSAVRWSSGLRVFSSFASLLLLTLHPHWPNKRPSYHESTLFRSIHRQAAYYWDKHSAGMCSHIVETKKD
jgi:hypothetical protein